ncbi:MAG: DUF4139 domain-containing protein [Planctomycetes bacterium]|nr:DUF4139 domain-containing protein [Planctomycetota bacterium]
MQTTILNGFVLAALLAAPSFAGARDAEALELASRVDAVTVYGGSARVTRVTEPVQHDGRFVLRGLTRQLDPSNVRVRLERGHVLGVEVAERRVDQVPEARVQALRDELRALDVAAGVRADEERLLAELVTHVQGQLSAVSDEDDDALPSLEAWSAAHAAYDAALADLLRQRRDLRWAGEADAARRDELRRELGTLEAGGLVPVYDVFVEVDLGAGPSPLAVEYFVGDCGWKPVYDLRTAGDARSVELVYRAEVVQRSGEDWPGVELALSTATPRRGAAGPEPEPRWVDLGGRQDDSLARRGLFYEDSARYDARLVERGLESADKGYFAAAQDAGLSVRFVLPARETLASRDAATTVLVGEARLDVEPELYCVPALADDVWLRGHARNTSPWVLLPGVAAVFFGDDFIGRAAVDEVQTGQELDLALGVVPGLELERVLVGEEHDAPGLFSSTAREITRWRVRLENHGAPVTEPDGSVRVVVREAIPQSRDERLEVEVRKSSHPVSTDPRWRADRDDRGFVTWVVPVPKDGETDLTWELVLAHPESRELILE